MTSLLQPVSTTAADSLAVAVVAAAPLVALVVRQFLVMPLLALPLDPRTPACLAPTTVAADVVAAAVEVDASTRTLATPSRIW